MRTALVNLNGGVRHQRCYWSWLISRQSQKLVEMVLGDGHQMHTIYYALSHRQLCSDAMPLTNSKLLVSVKRGFACIDGLCLPYCVFYSLPDQRWMRQVKMTTRATLCRWPLTCVPLKGGGLKIDLLYYSISPVIRCFYCKTSCMLASLFISVAIPQPE